MPMPFAVGSQMIVSVVVPTFRRHLLLDRCLGALMAQEIAPDAYEIVVVDDAADAATEKQVAQHALCAGEHGVSVRYIAVKGQHGPAAARNLGWRAAHGALIAFTDDDCIPAPNWLRAGVAAFGEGVTGVAGRISVPLSSAPTDYERNVAQLAQATFVTANCFYRRDALAAVGGFDERFEVAWREDSDLTFRLLQNGARLITVETAVVSHPVRPASFGISLRQQRKSQYNALLYKKHPALYRQRIQATPPWRYYATVGALGVACWGMLRRRHGMLLFGVALWLLFTALFCHRRLQGTSSAPEHVAEMAITSALIPPLAVFWRLRGAMRYRVWFW